MNPEIFQEFNKKIVEINSKSLFTYSGELNPEIQELIDELNKEVEKLLNSSDMPEAKYCVGEFIRWKQDDKSQTFFSKSVSSNRLIDKVILWENEASELYEIEKITVEEIDGEVMIVYHCKNETGKTAVIPEGFADFAF